MPTPFEWYNPGAAISADHPIHVYIESLDLVGLQVYAVSLFARLETEGRKVEQARTDALNEVAEAVKELLNPEPEEDED